MSYGNAKFDELLGKTLTEIKGGVGDEKMFFTTNEGEVYKLHYVQD